MGHYGCNDLLSILSSVYSAFFTVNRKLSVVFVVHVVVVHRRHRNVPKSVLHVQSCCFANLNLLLSCRRRRRCLSFLTSSPVSDARDFAVKPIGCRFVFTTYIWVSGTCNFNFSVSIYFVTQRL